MTSERKPLAFALIGLVLIALAISSIGPFDRTTWWLEVAPVLIALPFLLATREMAPWSTLLWFVLALHALVLIAGGHYSYARVPLGEWLREGLDLARNPYDRIGHFMQGVTPALLAREALLRSGKLRRSLTLLLLCIAVALAFSACYELIEWAAAIGLGQGADEFLGTQGDPWDTQADMAMASLGAVFAMVMLARLQDASVTKTAGGWKR